MSKYMKPERKDKKEKDHKKKETKDRDIHLNVIGVPVTNVSVDKTLERRPASDFHMYRISIDTSSRSSKETKEKRSSTIRGLTSPRAVSNPPRPVRIPIIPSDSSSTGSDVSHRLPRSVSTSAMKNAEPQSGKANAAHNPRDKHHGSKKARPKPPPKKTKDNPVVCYTEEKRPLRIVGRLKTPEDDRDRQRKLSSGRKNSKQVEFSDENSVYVAGDEEHPIGNAFSNVPYKGTAPNVVQNKGNSHSLFGSKNIPYPDPNQEELSKPLTISQPSKKSDKSDIADDKRSELKTSMKPELKNTDRQNSDDRSNDRIVNYRPLDKSNAPEYSLSSRPPDVAGPSREWPNQSNIKPGKSSIEDRKEPMPKKRIDVDDTYADPTKNYPAYKPVGNSYSRKQKRTPSAENAAKGYISPTYSNDSTGYPKERPNHDNMKPVRSYIDEKKDTMPTKSNVFDTETQDQPTKNYPSYKHVGNSYSGKINVMPSEENAKRGYISPTYSKDSTGYPNDRSSYPIMKPVGSSIANKKETIINEDFVPKLNQYDGKTTPIIPEEHSYTKNINATPSNKNAAKVPPRDYNETSRLPENKTNNMGVPSSARNETRRETSNKKTSISQLLDDKTGYGQLKGGVHHSELPPVKSFVEGIPMEKDIFSETPSKKVVPKHAAKDSRTIDVIGNDQLDGKNFNLKRQSPLTEKYTQVFEKYDTNITPISKRSISPTSMLQNQDNSGIQPEHHYASSSNRAQYEPTAEKKSMTATSMAPPKIQFKRMDSTPLSKRSSKESTGPKGHPMDRSPSRMKYLTYPLVSSIPKPTITSSKYNSAVDDRDANEGHFPLEKPSKVQERKLGGNTSTDTMDRMTQSKKSFPITVDYEDFYAPAQSPVYYTVQDGQPQPDGRSVEISHRTYGELSPVDTLGKIPNNSPMDVSLEGHRANEIQVNSNYIGMDPRDKQALYNKSQKNPNFEEPVFTASYIPTNHISKSIKDLGFSHKFNTQPADSLVVDNPRESGTNFLNLSPKYSVAPSRRVVNQDEMNYPLEFMKTSDVKDTDLNARTSKENSKHSVNENLFENKMHNDYEGITPQDIYNGSHSPSSHDWPKSGTSKPEVYAYVGHIDPNNPFGHKPDHEEDLLVDHINDILPDVSKYIENDTVPRGSVEAPGSEHRFDEHVISNQEFDQFYNSSLYKDDLKGIPKAESKRIRGSVNEVPLGRVIRASKRSMPTIETIQEEDFETGVSDSFFKLNSAKPALDEEGEIYNHTIPVSSEVAGRQSRNASLVHADDLNQDSEIYGYGSNDKRDSPRDMFAYLGDVDNANPFDHKGGVDGMSDKENLKNKSDDYPRDKILMMPLVGSRGVSSEPRDNSTAKEFRVLPNENESAETSTLIEKNKVNLKPEKEPLPSAKAKRKSRESEKGRGTIISLESNRRSSEPEAVFLGKIPKTTMNVFYSPNNESKTLPANAEARQLGDGPIQQTDSGSIITEGPKGILIFVNKKNDKDRSPFENPDRLKNKRSTDYLSKNSKGDSRSSKGKTVVDKEGSTSLVKKEYPCGCIRTTKLDRNNELIGEDLLSVGCRDGSQCHVRLPRLQKHDRLLSFDESRTESVGRFKKSRNPSSEFPEIEIVADGVVSKKPIAPKPPKPTMKGVNLTGTINLKSNKFNGVCHLYLEPRLKEYLRNNMHILQELLEKDERKSSKRSS